MNKLEITGLKINDNKYILVQSSVNFLGYNFNATGIKPVEDRAASLNAAKYNWQERHTNAFQNNKHALINATELTYPNRNATFTVRCDAITFAIGSCLHQVVDGESFPLSFFSRKLSEHDKKYIISIF